ncbi:MAG: hypothetical protein ACO3C5_07415 [Ilumatobacteraceae bacterium]
MNTNRTSNKNVKRFAIAAGATAAVLFLSAGFVASRGGESNNNKNADAPLAVVSSPTLTEVAEVVEKIVADAPITAQPTASAPASTATESTATESIATQSTASIKVTSTPKKSKKSPIPAGDVILFAPDASTTAELETTVAPAPAVADAAVVSVPTEQPAVEQPAPTAPAEEPAATSSAPASQSGTTAISVPKLTMDDSLVSSLQGIDLTKQWVKTALPKLCIPGITC